MLHIWSTEILKVTVDTYSKALKVNPKERWASEGLREAQERKGGQVACLPGLDQRILGESGVTGLSQTKTVDSPQLPSVERQSVSQLLRLDKPTIARRKMKMTGS